MTFNEVISICELGYQLEVFAPQMGLGFKGKYVCGHNIILAHAKTVRLYRAKYAPTQKGKVSIALDGKWGYPYDPKVPAGEFSGCSGGRLEGWRVYRGGGTKEGWLCM
jgi:beta-glucosidase